MHVPHHKGKMCLGFLTCSFLQLALVSYPSSLPTEFSQSFEGTTLKMSIILDYLTKKFTCCLKEYRPGKRKSYNSCLLLFFSVVLNLENMSKCQTKYCFIILHCLNNTAEADHSFFSQSLVDQFWCISPVLYISSQSPSLKQSEIHLLHGTHSKSRNFRQTDNSPGVSFWLSEDF